MSADVTIRDIAAALGISVRAVNLRASMEKWFCSGERDAHGGRAHLYPVGLLPADVGTAVLIHLANREAVASGAAEASRAKLADAASSHDTETRREAGLALAAGLPEERQRVASIKAELVGYFDQYIRRSGLPRYRALALFVKQYNDGILQVRADIRAARPTISARSLEYWESQLAHGGLARLAGNYGRHRKGNGTIDQDDTLRDFILGMLVDHPHVSAKLIMRGIRARFVEARHPGIRNLQRWLRDWKASNPQLFTAVTNPDAWRSKFKAAGGDMAAGIVRLNQRWETDGTKGDLILADNRRHTVTGIIDIYSRRLKLHVSRSSSAAAVASAMRRAILDWGIPEQLGTDNGSDFVSRHMKGVIAGLGIDHDVAPPYTPEHKPFIERAFGTFCHGLVELLPGFVGANVTERKAIEARRSFAQRLMKAGGEKIELRMTAAEFQGFCDQWTDTVYARDPHSGLGGKSPFQRAAEWTAPIRAITNPRALDILLLPPADGGIRTIGKKGIRLDHAWFEAPELGGREGEDVRVLLDDADIGAIYVFALDGAYIAQAWCPERAGIGRQELALRRAARQKDVLREQKADLRAAAKRAGTDTIVADILAERAGEAAKVVAFPQPSVPYTTPDLDAAALATHRPTIAASAPTEDEMRAIAAIAAELASPPAPEPDDGNVVRLQASIAAELAGDDRAPPPLRRVASGGGASIIAFPEVKEDADGRRVRVLRLALARVALAPERLSPLDRFIRALAVEAECVARRPVEGDAVAWFKSYANCAEYAAHRTMYLDFGIDFIDP